MFENYETANLNKRPNNMKQFLDSCENDTLVIGGTSQHVFKINCQFDRYYKEASMIYRQSIDGTQVLIKTWNATKKELEIKQITTDNTVVEATVDTTYQGSKFSYDDGTPKKVKQLLSGDVHSYIISTITPEESQKFVFFRNCYVQLKLVDLRGKVSYSEKKFVKVCEPLDADYSEELLTGE